MPRACVGVGPPFVDTVRRRRDRGVRGGRGVGLLRDGELRFQLVGGGRRRRRLTATTKDRPEAETAGQQREQALRCALQNRRDATLPPLLATPVAPSPEAALVRWGRFSP